MPTGRHVDEALLGSALEVFLGNGIFDDDVEQETDGSLIFRGDVAPADRSACDTDLAQTTADLTACEGDLARPPTSDGDNDGETDRTDLCPNTTEGVEVDLAGCSLAQFCSQVETTTGAGKRRCKKSDWKNDEPLMRKRNAD